MRTIHINRAAGTSYAHVEPVTIVIDGVDIKDKIHQCIKEDSSNWQNEARRIYDEEAEQIVEALAQSLPGGTMDRVIGRLLERRASLLVIPLFAFKGD